MSGNRESLQFNSMQSVKYLQYLLLILNYIVVKEQVLFLHHINHVHVVVEKEKGFSKIADYVTIYVM